MDSDPLRTCKNMVLTILGYIIMGHKYSKIRAKWLTDGHDDNNYGKCEHIMLETINSHVAYLDLPK